MTQWQTQSLLAVAKLFGRSLRVSHGHQAFRSDSNSCINEYIPIHYACKNIAGPTANPPAPFCIKLSALTETPKTIKAEDLRPTSSCFLVYILEFITPTRTHRRMLTRSQVRCRWLARTVMVEGDNWRRGQMDECEHH